MSERLDATPSLSDRTARTLMDKIDAGELRHGRHMSFEIMLGQGFGVSRAVIHKVILRLRYGGVIEARQGSGMYVTQQASLRPLWIGATQAGLIGAVLHIIELRRVLEAESAALAAQHRTDAEMTEIDTAFDSIDATVTAGGDGMAEDLCLHRAITAASDNSPLVQTLGFSSQYLGEVIGVMCSSGAHRENFARQICDEHHAMVKMVRHRDVFTARSATRTHMFNAARCLTGGRDVA